MLWDQRTAPLMEANTTDGAPTHTHTHTHTRKSDQTEVTSEHIRTYTYVDTELVCYKFAVLRISAHKTDTNWR